MNALVSGKRPLVSVEFQDSMRAGGNALHTVKTGVYRRSFLVPLRATKLSGDRRLS
jgi:hypothetical protein